MTAPEPEVVQDRLQGRSEELDIRNRIATSWPNPPFRPSKIVAIGRNYADHAKEMESAVPAEPLIFLKPPSSLVPLDMEHPIVLPSLPTSLSRVDHEIELGIVIGKQARKVHGVNALEHVAGFCIVLDITARDLQKIAKQRGEPWAVSKGFDTFCPVSRAVSLDALKESGKTLDDLDLVLEINGKVVQKGNTRDMMFSPVSLITYISQVMTLEPGDLISTGTPAGVGPLKHGDVLECTLGGLIMTSTRVE